MAEKTYIGEVTVRAEGIPVRYYPWENRLEHVECRDMEDGCRTLAVSIAPLELCILMFLPKEEYGALGEKVTDIRAASDKEQYTVEKFSVGRVEAKAYLEQLEQAGVSIHSGKAVVKASETEEGNAPFAGMQNEYPDFSGYYIYETEVALKPGQDYILEIEQVCEAAEVFWNGKSLGTKVQGPYRFEIPAAFVEESNLLRIEAATLLERKVRAMGVNFAAMSSHRPMSPTGILGNVTIAEV